MLAILSKSATVMLPVVLGLCWWWMERGWRWRNALWLAPFFFISGLASAWTVWEQKYDWGARGPDWNQSLAERVIIAGKDFWFYLGKLAWPHPLIFIYPRWTFDTTQAMAWAPAVAMGCGLLGLWCLRKGKGRAGFFAMGYFAVSVFPVLGFFNVYFYRYSFVGDHFQYLASMGPLALAGAGLTWLAQRGARERAMVYPAACGVLLVGCGIMTFWQCGMYQNLETLWRVTLARNPDCYLARFNLGDVLVRQGRLEEAAAQYREVLRFRPESGAEVHGNLANVLMAQGRAAEAAAEYRAALRINPGSAAAHGNLSHALARLGEDAEAISEARKAVELQPGEVDSEYYLAWMLATVKEPGLRDGARAVELATRANAAAGGKKPAILRTLGAAYAQAGRFGEAVQAVTGALQLAGTGGETEEEMRREIRLYEAGAAFREP